MRHFDATVAVMGDCQHVRLDGTGDSIRLDIIGGSALDGPVQLSPEIVLERDVDAQLSAVCRLRAMLTGGTLPAPTDKRLPRLILALRALDARAENASTRTIAVELLGTDDWPGDGDWMKSWARRLIALSDRLLCAGPAGILQRAV
ncbi:MULTISPECIES: DNA -binding domain-containing protein [unclassified Sphingomonas]|uniref:DNA -binding domain-containing protein n=1 Tax=unclassified Sphingomonas TaxID=196159 RepID=UPI0007020669|nr:MULTISPECIES: DUF2285 domain-containing protein [unclassified Sphingomonas]KQX19146.1 hypothetical protein ASD17_11300 [Sphingomonas sp. Root1294]KQY65347.1 hypothetical protein ASD39_14495 [Sphingomonas sp. Root50]KRB95360.1 hypothetical protein ASE22_05560 [Sphingomonas sp. Root720]